MRSVAEVMGFSFTRHDLRDADGEIRKRALAFKAGA
jgi:hypothetical protein